MIFGPVAQSKPVYPVIVYRAWNVFYFFGYQVYTTARTYEKGKTDWIDWATGSKTASKH
jgi:hypothetical protein